MWKAQTHAADAQRRGHPVTLLVTETTGALSPTFDRALRALGKHARAPTTHDSTRYGLSRSSPRTFLPCSPSRGYLGGRRSQSDSQSVISRSRPALTPPPARSPAPPLPSLRRSRGRDYHISRRTRHELQAHHRHVALLNRPRAGPALVCEVLV